MVAAAVAARRWPPSTISEETGSTPSLEGLGALETQTPGRIRKVGGPFKGLGFRVRV